MYIYIYICTVHKYIYIYIYIYMCIYIYIILYHYFLRNCWSIFHPICFHHFDFHNPFSVLHLRAPHLPGNSPTSQFASRQSGSRPGSPAACDGWGWGKTYGIVAQCTRIIYDRYNHLYKYWCGLRRGKDGEVMYKYPEVERWYIYIYIIICICIYMYIDIYICIDICAYINK